MSVYLIIGTIIWVYGLSLLRRTKLAAFSFIWGSVGLFFILITLSNRYMIWLFTQAVMRGVGWIGEVAKMSTNLTRYSIISIANASSPVNMVIDYECSGVIETLAFLSLVFFFPMYSRYEKLFFSVLGMLWIYLANILRLLLIIIIVHFSGGQFFFVAHSLLGRLFFYVLVIALYYLVFTSSQLSHSIYFAFRERMHHLLGKEGERK
ncbi:membrane protein [Liquorilactobacillus sucicola DSM 21376 = JCM 15457]|uniref:Exosortase family protein XrtG n=1 Tax=Liquorilactobacillus sucicola DSM 21376 = JCM 15457 TaxID=1423806 RepID=A0A023D042_9LACO|nr:exosortase family protein XrtG [Liquorilactobacillus sucicola]KRN07358.1 hypothetical protein FD15_GL002305 [Liquorilactobacillus sucicola DSM 21376 = JCM 15457]GAJ27502.1 membrane protein [Liquorilactobacillus sucicola DSM 21376 = JCM 15457]